MASRRIVWGPVLAAAVLTVLAGWGVVEAEKATTQGLGGAPGERYLAYVSTDKPIYRAGEKVYVRGVVLSSDARLPLKKDKQANAMVEVHGPKGDVISSGMSQTQDSVAGFAWDVPEGAAGGEYTVKLMFPWDGYPPAERKFEVRAYRAPRLKSQIVFLRDGYGPRDTVQATLHTERAEGGIPAGAQVTATARVDGAEVYNGQTKIDAKGNCTVSFALPNKIVRGEGTVALAIADGGVVETATKTIPILLQTVDLTMYPEGGDLVAGLSSRVYLEAKTPAKKPADIAGVVVDSKGHEVAQFKTEHEGRGRFEIKPAKGETYTLKITQPSGISTTYPLPAVKPAGAVIHALSDIVAKDGKVTLHVESTAPNGVTVTLGQRETQLDKAKLGIDMLPIDHIAKWEPTLDPKGASGVLVATVWGDDGKPLAERLIYRQPAKQLAITINADKPQYATGEKVSLTVKAIDADGKPAEAVVGLTVTDESVLEMIEKREQAPRLPVMVFLESDVQELADAHVYLDPANPRAALATDLLLGTQGWRRFALADPAKFVEDHGDAARRVLALKLATAVEVEAANFDAAAMPRGAAFGMGGAKAGAAPRAFHMARNMPEGAVLDDLKKNMDKDVADEDMRRPVDKPMQKMEQALERADQINGKRMAGIAAAMPAAPRPPAEFPFVREYAHDLKKDRDPGQRTDFTETLFWSPTVKTDAKTGEAKVSFALSDAVTSFRASADGFDQSGSLGAGTSAVQSVQPFYVEPKLPLEVTSGDVIQVPVSLVNATAAPLTIANLSTTISDGLFAGPIDGFTLAAGQRSRRILPITVGDFVGTGTLTLAARAEPYGDKVTRTLVVKPMGFPIEETRGGLLQPDSSLSFTIEIPDSVVRRSAVTEVAVYPTPLASLTEALARLMQEPNGCFEQTSSTNYPLVMAQQYFTSHTGVDPKMIEKSSELLGKGYARLLSFECKDKGYEWFGEDPGHTALSAFGLLEFTDMSKVREVDPKMLENTRHWLLKMRDGKGGFANTRRALHTWNTDPDCVNGYTCWAILESGDADSIKQIEKEIAAFKEAAQKSQNSYVVALGADIAGLSKDQPLYKKLCDQLASKLSKDGYVDGGTTTIVGSEGQSLQIETTSLAILAWLRDSTYTEPTEKSIRWLADVCKGGAFGSTQSTVLALRAIVTYDKARAHPKAPGTLRLTVDGKPIGDPVSFDENAQGALKLPDISAWMTPGKHTVTVAMEKGSAMPYTLSVKYHSTQPNTAPECKLTVKASLRDAKVAEGSVTEAAVVVTNKTDKAVPTPVAIIGIPGGLEVRHDQLKELKKAGKIAAYEVIGRDVVLYWRELKANETVELPISVVAAIPGAYTGPASRAYLYYSNEFKTWDAGMKVVIEAKE